jgi:hypothetical protein
MKFYEFNQNNSDGSFITDKEICHRLFIEAANEDEAVQVALEKGVYFEGCAEDRDCPYCGDRWSDSPNEYTYPISWGRKVNFSSVIEYAQYLADNYGRTTPDSRVFYTNGKVIEIFSSKE